LNYGYARQGRKDRSRIPISASFQGGRHGPRQPGIAEPSYVARVRILVEPTPTVQQLPGSAGRVWLAGIRICPDL